MNKVEIPFSSSKEDQARLGLVGGNIALKPNNIIVFQFDSQEQYQKYLELKNK